MGKRRSRPPAPSGAGARIPISYSGANLFERCPQRFYAEKFSRSASLTKARPIYLLTGVFLHELTDQYHKHLVKTKQQTDYCEADRIFDAGWASPLRSGIPEDTYPELSEVWSNIKQMVIVDSPGFIESEMAIALTDAWEKTSWEDPQALLRMKIDLLTIDGGKIARVWDLKTGHKILAADESMQMKIYAAAVKAMFPKVESIVVELCYPRFFRANEHTIEENDILEARRWVTNMSAQIERARVSGNWPATPGSACSDCPIFNHCPARAIGANLVPPINVQEAEQLVSRLILIERERKDVIEKLKVWVTINGSVSIGGMVAGMGVKSRTIYDIGELHSVLSRYGVKIEDAVVADNLALKRICKSKDGLEEALAAIAIQKSSSDFRLGKAER